MASPRTTPPPALHPPARPRAVLLLSGGLDSATTGAIARAEGYQLYAMSFRYGQRHAVELERATAVAAWLGVARHQVVTIDLRAFGGSALTDGIAVPKDRDAAAIAAATGAGAVPVTYVPARNTIFLSYALGWAEVLGARDVFVGANALDYSGYPDCRPAFLQAFERTANLGTKAGAEALAATGEPWFRIRAPLVDLSKAEIIRRGTALGLDYALTLSCYDPAPDGAACGACDSCRLRARGFREAGVADPTPYQAGAVRA
ncbi:MAG TPA: 7-cyano-7-deazaguanine synthase QueC [Gemmatimonadales bacterium]|nr:7-cyano-7-deazaguanine synthase QueC [Gemmatimonadales bacterium]